MASSCLVAVLLLCCAVGLQADVPAREHVAFAVALKSDSDEAGDIGPLTTDTRVVFKRVVTNVGGGYDSDTGIFTAPVKGLYFITFTGAAGETGSLNAAVLKDGVNMFAIYDNKNHHSSATNGMAMVMEAGDKLWVTLWANQRMFDQGRLSTFSGFLISPM
ncbi:complement C1q tumor necrosis factor-related protein 3-like [Nerophis lumbriciformis]|uniref:complement C1q tumor necrosis factor-related protein 3-like n=1 Tax=Nerophis lumbriciformis TaxID=546530 RepID=UPI003BA977A1